MRIALIKGDGIGVDVSEATMAVVERNSVEPNGKPKMARKWFSNWQVSAPCMVQ